MAMIGLKKPIFVPIKTEVDGALPTYDSAKVVAVGEAISANVNFTRAGQRLDADDHLTEYDNSITGGNVTLNVDDLTLGAENTMLGVEVDGTTYTDTDAIAPAGGFGFIRVRSKKNVRSYIAHWFPKIQFAKDAESMNTKAPSSGYQTPSITGELFGVPVTDTEAPNGISTKFRQRAEFPTEKEAANWLKERYAGK